MSGARARLTFFVASPHSRMLLDTSGRYPRLQHHRIILARSWAFLQEEPQGFEKALVVLPRSGCEWHFGHRNHVAANRRGLQFRWLFFYYRANHSEQFIQTLIRRLKEVGHVHGFVKECSVLSDHVLLLFHDEVAGVNEFIRPDEPTQTFCLCPLRIVQVRFVPVNNDVVEEPLRNSSKSVTNSSLMTYSGP